MAGQLCERRCRALAEAANLVLNREETRTVLRIANADGRALWTKVRQRSGSKKEDSDCVS